MSATTPTMTSTGRPAAAAVATAALDEALRAASRFAAKRPKVPALGAVLVEFSGPALRITSTDYDVRFTRVLGDSDGPWVHPVAVPALDLVAAVKRLVRRAETVAVTARGKDLVVVHGRGEVSFGGLDAEDFPAPSSHAFGAPAEVGYDTWTNLYRVAVAVGSDPFIPVLTAIRLVNDHGQLGTAATDRTRFALATGSATSQDAWEALVPAAVWKQTLAVLKPPARAEEPTLRLEVAPTDTGQARWLRIRSGASVIETQLLDGSFPQLAALFGPDPVAIGSADRAALAAAVEAAAVVWPGNRGPVAIDLTSDEGTVTGQSSSSTVLERFPAKPGEDAAMVYLPAAKAIDGLAALTGDWITITRHGPGKPVRFDDGDETFTYVLMPTRPTPLDG